MRSPAGALHHIELWVPDLARAVRSWGWLLELLGYAPDRRWEGGVSWRLGPTYVVLEESTALVRDPPHDRRRAGLNHLAFHAGSRALVARAVDGAESHGWTLLFPDRHPHAGGPDHHAAYLEDRDGFEVELVAPTPAPGAQG